MDGWSKFTLAWIIGFCLVILASIVKLEYICKRTYEIVVLEAKRDSINQALDIQLKWLELHHRINTGYIKPEVKAHVDSVYHNKFISK